MWLCPGSIYRESEAGCSWSFLIDTHECFTHSPSICELQQPDSLAFPVCCCCCHQPWPAGLQILPSAWTACGCFPLTTTRCTHHHTSQHSRVRHTRGTADCEQSRKTAAPAWHLLAVHTILQHAAYGESDVGRETNQRSKFEAGLLLCGHLQA